MWGRPLLGSTCCRKALRAAAASSLLGSLKLDQLDYFVPERRTSVWSGHRYLWCAVRAWPALTGAVRRGRYTIGYTWEPKDRCGPRVDSHTARAGIGHPPPLGHLGYLRPDPLWARN
jgi:hypothetical protein